MPSPDNNNPKLRVLLIAEAANPDMVSVPLVGWSHAQALAEVADVHVVTQVRNREPILKRGWREGEAFTALDTECVTRPLRRLGKFLAGKRGGWTFITASQTLAYYWFERKVWKQFGQSIKAREWDVVHRLTPLSPAIPSLIARKCSKAGVPFVIGPLNGGVPWPKAFVATQRREREWLSRCRGMIKVLPGYTATRRHASAILVASRFTYDQMPEDSKGRCIYLPENGIDPERFTTRRTHTAKLPLKVVFVGRLVPLKGVDMLIEALAPLLTKGAVELTLIGEGPEQEHLKHIALEQGVSAQVRFAGWIAHEKLAAELSGNDVLALPSIREFGGGVVLEAMTLGLVPVVADYGGPRELVTDETGFRVGIGSRKQLVAGLRSVFSGLVDKPEQIEPMSKACVDYVDQHFTWAVKAQKTLAVYRWVTGQCGTKPDFEMPPPNTLNS